MIKIENLTINRLYYGSIEIPKVYFKDVVVYGDDEPSIPNNEIWYWTTDGNTAQTTNATGINSLNTMGLVSNEVVGDKCVMTFSKDVTSIGDYAFFSCTSLTSVTIPDSVTEIGKNVFRDCSSLTSITIPDSVTIISIQAFRNCTSLASVTIGNSVTSIDGNAFYQCTSLSSVTIPNSVTSINSGAFGSVPTGGTLYCDEDWFNNLSNTNKTNLGNVKSWTRNPISF